MGIAGSPDIFQEKMSALMDQLEYVRMYLDDLLVLTKDTYADHLQKLQVVLTRLQDAGLRVNVTKSILLQPKLSTLDTYWIERG